MQIKQKKLLNISYFSVLSSESHGAVGAAVATTEGAGEGIEQRVAGRHTLSLRHFMQAAQLPHEG